MWLNNKNEIYLNIYEKELKKRKEEYENTKLQLCAQIRVNNLVGGSPT